MNAVHLMITGQLTGVLQVLTMPAAAPVLKAVPRGTEFPYCKINIPIVTQRPRAGQMHRNNISVQVDVFDNETDSQRAVLLSSQVHENLADSDLTLPTTDGFRFVDQRLEIERLQEENSEEGERIWHSIMIIMFQANQVVI